MKIEERLERFRQDVKQDFHQVDQRFDQVDQRFEQVDQRFEQVDQRFEQVDRRFEQVDRRFDRIEVRLETLDGNVQALDGKVQTLDGKIDGVNSSLRALIEDNSSRIDKLTEGFEAVTRRLDLMEARNEERHAEILDFFDRVGSNHELRIQRLEKHSGLA